MNNVTKPNNVVSLDDARKAKAKNNEQKKRERARRNLLAAAAKLDW